MSSKLDITHYCIYKGVTNSVVLLLTIAELAGELAEQFGLGRAHMTAGPATAARNTAMTATAVGSYGGGRRRLRQRLSQLIHLRLEALVPLVH